MKKILILVPLILILINCGNGDNGHIKAPGIVDGDIITLKSQAAGTIDTLEPAEGDFVEESSVIARINSDKIKNQLKELEITLKEIEINRQKAQKKIALTRKNLEYLQKQTDRFKRLRKTKSIAGEKVESMELRLLEAKTTRFDLEKTIEALDVQREKIDTKKEYLELLLEDHIIRAPVKGKIIETFVSRGENIFPNSPVADILDTGSLYVEVFVEEGEMARLKLNQRARIMVDGVEGKDLYGTVTFFGQKAEFSPKYVISETERKSLLYKVKVKINENVELFKVGMPVTIVFTETTKAASEANRKDK